MPKQREILSQNITFDCKLCDKAAMKSTGFSNHVNSMHVKKGHISSLEEYYNVHINILWGNNKNTCNHCGKETKFVSIFEGYQEFCCHKCSVSTEEHKLLMTSRIKEVMLEKYGVEHSSQLPGFSDKIKKTKLKRYGDENYVNPLKAKETVLKKYGEDCYTKTEEYKQKLKNTCLEKYGVEHFTQNEEVKRKIRETNLERYGVEIATKNEDVKRKTRETVMIKYGVKSSLNLYHAREKMKKYKNDAFTDKLTGFIFHNVSLVDAEKRIFKCKICNDEFVFYDNITLAKNQPSRFPHCKKCKPVGKNPRNSLIQQEINGFLIDLCKIDHSTFHLDYKGFFDDSNKELDFYFHDKKVAIEINGNYYHAEIIGNKDKNYHINKTLICEYKGVQLIQIFSDEWNDKKEIVKNRIKNILGYNDVANKIGARKCVVKKIDSNTANEFMNNNHLQGSEKSSTVRYGAFYNNELVACMTFGSERISLGSRRYNQDGYYELLRFCTKIGYSISGVAGKLFSQFVKDYNPKNIISYADRRWSSSAIKDTVYTKLGFKEIGRSEPNYYYLLREDNYRKRFNRFKFRKSELNKLLSQYDPSISEWENMVNNGHDRIWDCGTIKYEWANREL